jgi:hypothetical protein
MQQGLLDVSTLDRNWATTGRMGRCGWRFKCPQGDSQKEEEQQKEPFLLLME